jgi:rod shape determining protein RodA
MYLDRRMLGNIDWRIVGTMLALIGVGILTIWSANLGSPTPPRQTLYLRQAVYAALGLVVLLTVAFINYRTVARFAYPIFGVVLVLLIVVSVAGEVGRGAQRWLRIGTWTLQPSEFMKLALIVFLARYFEDNKDRLGHPRLLVIPAVVALPPMFLVLRQPDLGTAVLLGMLTVSVLLLVGLRVKHLVFLAAATAAMAPLLWSFLKDYQRRRVLVFLYPELDPSGAGYHIAQSKIAVGSGELLGKGVTAASQSQLHFLPASYTDFILAVLAEQWGFIGCLVILFLYYVLITRGLEIAQEAKDIFGALLTFGVMTMITVQVVVNVGMVVGMMPVVGIPLPLLSYGGSSLVVTCIGIGLVMSVRMRRFLY